MLLMVSAEQEMQNLVWSGCFGEKESVVLPSFSTWSHVGAGEKAGTTLIPVELDKRGQC